MEDSEIIGLFFARDERALAETEKKYGRYCAKIASNILPPADAEECVNHVWLKAWSDIPPQKPKLLSAYLGKLTRAAAFNLYRDARAQKRGGGEMALVLDELAECLSGGETVEKTLEDKELGRALGDFVAALPRDKQRIFIMRYWQAERVENIAKRVGKTRVGVSKTLERTRKQLKEYLEERGFEI